MENNLELWDKVSKTNPAYTKAANVKGNRITSIAPQHQIKNVTEQFGIYGKSWGFKDISLDYSLVTEFGLVVFKATFFFPSGEFPIINSVSLFMDNAKTKVDDNFAKKVETDTLTKAISKLGFNADVFEGKFDDLRYVEQLNQEFNPKPLIDDKNGLDILNQSKTIDELRINWSKLTTQEQALPTIVALKDKLKEKLIK